LLDASRQAVVRLAVETDHQVGVDLVDSDGQAATDQLPDRFRSHITTARATHRLRVKGLQSEAHPMHPALGDGTSLLRAE